MLNEFAAFITKERKEKGMSTAELSRKADVPYTTLDQIEKGRSIPQIVTFDKIITALDYELILMKKTKLEEIFKES